jgi:glucosamine-6-phosphate deaminase
MKFIKVKEYSELSKLGSDIIVKQICDKPNSVLGLATGSTPQGIYDCLIEEYRNGKIDFSQIITFNLDEYLGLEPTHPQSYHCYMDINLFNKINVNILNVHMPNGLASDFIAEAENYDRLIEDYGNIDLQLLGIGLNGHIGFNEPDKYFTMETHIVNLDISTIEANSRFFPSVNKVPTQAITMGIGSIMKAKTILLVANGQKKKEILEQALYGPVTPEVPASILQLHPNLIVIYSEQ